MKSIEDALKSIRRTFTNFDPFSKNIKITKKLISKFIGHSWN